MVRAEDLNSALTISRQTTLPLGKCLIALNHISVMDLRNAVQLQSMLRDEVLSADEGDRVMRLCCSEKLALSRALNRTGLISVSGHRVRLGRLLLECDLVDLQDLPRHLLISQTTCLPLGMVLINNHKITQSTLESLIDIQSLIRRKNLKITDIEVSEAIVNVRNQNRTSTVLDTRLGNLMILACVISKEELATAVDISLVNQKFIGELLVEFGWISKMTLDAALELQSALREGLTDLETAKKLLKMVHINQCDLDSTLSNSTPSFTRNLLLGKFLIIAGLVSQQELITARSEFITNVENFASEAHALIEKIMSEDPFVVQDIVCKAGLLNRQTAKAAYKYWQLSRHGLIHLVKAMVLLADHVIQQEQEQELEQTRITAASSLSSSDKSLAYSYG